MASEIRIVMVDSHKVRSIQGRDTIPYAVPSGLAASDKKLRKMRQNPSGWQISDLLEIAAESGLESRRPGRGGSHVIFGASGIREIVSVPAKRPIKPIYIKHFIALIDAARELESE